VLAARIFSLFVAAATTDAPPLSLHDALPICSSGKYSFGTPTTRAATPASIPEVRSGAGRSAEVESKGSCPLIASRRSAASSTVRSEEHTSELQSREKLVCRLLLEKKK